MEQGYYWAYRKGNPEPEVVYVANGHAYTVLHAVDGAVDGLDEESLAEQKWILGEKVIYEKE